MDVASQTWRRAGMANRCRQAYQQGCGRKLECFRDRTKQREHEHQCQSEPRAPDETETGFEKHRSGPAMQADIDERRIQNVGGDADEPDGARENGEDECEQN